VATLRTIRRRIAGVKNTQKITKAMKMVAASKLRRAQNTLVATRPYARAMNGLLRHLVTKIDPAVHPLLQTREAKRALVLVVSGDRGMCGAFNSNIMKAAVEFVKTRHPELKTEQHGLRLVAIGKKISDFCSKRGFDVYSRHAGIFGNLAFGHARAIMRELISGYLKKEFDIVEVVYNEFKSVIRQQIVVEQLLPILPEGTPKAKGLRSRAQVDYIYEPAVGEIIAALLPRHLDFQLWRILLESSTAEEGARMTAMNNATENAKELIRDLTLSYNKARQAAITKELLEIVSGAEALKRAS
jgi:F-type H+-transporting ATPase subunit gamma